MNLLSKVQPPNFRNKLISENQTVTDIAKLILKCERDSRIYLPKIANFFDGNTDIEKCKKVWSYLRNNIEYVKEPHTRQTAKTINRIIYDGFGDCKHYSIFCVSVLKYLGLPVSFRLCSFDLFKKEPTHIYAVVKYKDGREIVVDPCIRTFNKESNYNYKFDVKPLD